MNSVSYKKAVAYCRFSSDNQRSESIDAQMRAIREYAGRKNLLLVDEYVDKARSATTDNRPSFLRMIKDSGKGEFDAVIIHKLDRFARNRYDSAKYNHQLKRNKVKLLSVTENLDDSPESIIMQSVLEGMAEYYSQNLAREVMKGLKENAYKAKHTGGIPPLGYDIDEETRKYVLNIDEAKSIKYIYESILEGKSYSEIIKDLNARGYKTKRGMVFGNNSIYSLLKNEKYTGVYIYNKSSSKDIDGKRNSHSYKDKSEIIRIEGEMPQIISKDDFKKVQELLKRRKQISGSSTAKEQYLLTGHIRCGECGATLTGVTAKNREKNIAWSYYRCTNKKQRVGLVCNNKNIRRDELESFVLDKLSDIIFNGEYKAVLGEYNKLVKGASSELKQTRNSLISEMNKIDKQINNIVQAVAMNGGSVSLMNAISEYEFKRADIEQRLFNLDNKNLITEISQEEFESAYNEAKAMFKEGTLYNIKQLLDMYAVNLIVNPDSVEIEYSILPKKWVGYLTEFNVKQKGQGLKTLTFVGGDEGI